MTMRDLDERRIRGAIRLGVERGRLPETATAEAIEDVLIKWNLMIDGSLTNGAIALFGKALGAYTQMALRLARFRGTGKNEFLDSQRVSGNYFDLMDAGVAFLFKHLSQEGKIVGFNKEVKLPMGLTPESIKLSHASYPYNPLIAEVLFKTSFLENWGSGMARMVDACKEQGLLELEYESSGGFVKIVFKRPYFETTEKTTEKILRLMRENPFVTTAELAQECGLTPDGIYFHTKRLREHGIIRREGSRKNGRWIVSD